MRCKFIKALLCVIGLSVLASCESGKDRIKPSRETITESVYASGIVLSKNQYQVYSTVSGIIKTILVEEGDVVKKGQPLIRIVNSTAVLQADNAALAADYARLESNEEKLEDLRLAIELAAEKSENDRLLLERQQKLWEQKIGKKVELEQAELAYDNSVKERKSLQIKYNDLKRQLALNARQAENNRAISSIIADDYIVRSDIDGRVYSILKEPGELVSTQAPVALVGDADTFYLELQVDEYDIAKIIEGQKVFVAMDSYGDSVYEGIVTKVNPLMNEKSRSFVVEAAFTTRPARLYPYLTAEANILIREKTNALTIPRSYLVDESFVMTAKKKIKVVTGLKDYQKVEIVSGITAEDYLLKPDN